MQAIEAPFRQQPWALIVGAGPVGLTTANLLGRAGIPTLLIDRSAGLSGQPKALMVDDEFFRLLATLGLGQAVRDHGVGPVAFEVYSPLGFRVARIEGRTTEHHFPTRTATFQPEFERILLDGAQRHPCVTVRFGHELVALRQTAGEVIATLRGPRGDEHTVQASYLLAADGARSTVRKALDIPFDELVPFGQRQIVVDVADDPDQSKTAITRLGWRRNYTSLPAPNRGRRYEFSLRRGETAEAMLDDATLARLFRAEGLDYTRMKVIRKVVYTFHSRLARRLQLGRVFLLGDAAHIMPVFGSQGMNSGARDANNLAWKLAAVHSGKASPDILASYHDERHRHVAETIRIATANGRLQSVRHLPVTAVRDLFLGTLALVPALRRYVAEMRFIPKPYLHDGLVLARRPAAPPPDDPEPVSLLRDGLLLPAPVPARPRDRDRASLVGRVLPQPGVHAGHGHVLLDAIAGDGFALVGIEVDPGERPAALDDPLWQRLDARTVIVHRLPHAHACQWAQGVSVADAWFDPVFAAHRGEWLLVRPDRVVAMAAPGNELAGAARAFDRLLGTPRQALRLAS